MKLIFSEKNIVVILFVMVLITFSLAQEDSKKMDKMYSGVNAATASHFLAHHIFLQTKGNVEGHSSSPSE